MTSLVFEASETPQQETSTPCRRQQLWDHTAGQTLQLAGDSVIVTHACCRPDFTDYGATHCSFKSSFFLVLKETWVLLDKSGPLKCGRKRARISFPVFRSLSLLCISDEMCNLSEQDSVESSCIPCFHQGCGLQ